MHPNVPAITVAKKNNIEKEMKTKILISTLSLLFLFSCNKLSEKDYAELKAEVMSTESEFEFMANKDGLENAFLHFADDSAAINRNKIIYKGKAGIQEYFKGQESQNIILNWKPDFIYVAEAGDLAYTYGKFTYTAYGSADTVRADGIFHTIWKKQSDGSWRYIWD
jgi:ketosteroid isomerase-like protein